MPHYAVLNNWNKNVTQSLHRHQCHLWLPLLLSKHSEKRQWKNRDVVLPLEPKKKNKIVSEQPVFGGKQVVNKHKKV
jgi:hypothetical protein